MSALPTASIAATGPGAPARPRLRVGVLAEAGAFDPEALLAGLEFADRVDIVAADDAAAEAFAAAGAASIVLAPPGALPWNGGPALPGPEWWSAQLPASAGAEWLLTLSADERLSLELRDEIVARLSAVGPEARAFSARVARCSMGRYPRHAGRRSRELRLFKLPWPAAGADPLSAVELRELEHVLVGLGDRSIGDALERMNRRSESPARAAPAAGWRPLLLEPLAAFWRAYVRERSFQDGVAGLIGSGLRGAEVFLCAAKHWERRRRQSDPGAAR